MAWASPQRPATGGVVARDIEITGSGSVPKPTSPATLGDAVGHEIGLLLVAHSDVRNQSSSPLASSGRQCYWGSCQFEMPGDCWLGGRVPASRLRSWVKPDVDARVVDLGVKRAVKLAITRTQP